MKMKKTVALLSSLLLAVNSSAFALNYSGNLGNPTTFETMGEVQANAPAAMTAITAKDYAVNPAMVGYPADTTYVYRSEDMYGRNAAVRLNTNLVVFVEQKFEDKDAALAYLKDLGLTDIIEEATGSIVLVTPADGVAFGEADQMNYYKLQTAIFDLGSSVTIEDKKYSVVDGVYYGGFGYYYVIGIDGGATFLNNYIVGTVDYASRIAGMLLVNGKMERISPVASCIPTYLVNATQDTIDKYAAAAGADAWRKTEDVTLLYNQQFPARKVMVREAQDVNLKDIVKDAYYNLLIKGVRGQELKIGMNSASTEFKGYTSDCAPYSLHERNALINGVTVDGIHEITVVTDELKEFATPDGEYLQTWYEYMPEEVLNNTAPAGSVPLFLITHGGGDDPRQYVDGQGYLSLIGRERIALVAPDYSSMSVFSMEGKETVMKAFPALVRYTLAKYPALDASRVYVNGYSMGSLAAHEAAYGDPGLFAAAYPQAGIMSAAPTDAQKANFKDVNLPFCLSTSEYDLSFNVDPVTHNPVVDFYNLISDYLEMNDMERLPADGPDFEKYPMSGFKADICAKNTMNGEYTKYDWYFLNEDGVPMVGFNYIEDIVHCLYPSYAEMVWDFCKHYSRDLTTGAIIYNPNN